LCAELVSNWDNAEGDQDLIGLANTMDRARAALAEPVAPVGAPSDEDIYQWWENNPQLGFCTEPIKLAQSARVACS
jgi:hypothetical protein